METADNSLQKKKMKWKYSIRYYSKNRFNEPKIFLKYI